MQVSTSLFWSPKLGNLPEEYEDAYWPEQDAQYSRRSCSFALADGATQSSFARQWAKLLTQAYCEGLLNRTRFNTTIAHLQHLWRQSIPESPVHWFVQEKINIGAFATIIGLTLRKTESTHGLWRALAIGDSCLFHIREGSLLTSFPLQHSEQFTDTPALLSTTARHNRGLKRQILRITGIWRPGDSFFLMTDALACWFLRRHEELADPITQLRSVDSKDTFDNFLDRERNSLDEKGTKYLRNDDVTFFRINLA
jgi:hypothetical protein